MDDPRLRNGGRPGRKEILCEVHLALNIILVYTSHFEKIKNMHIAESCTNIPVQFREWLAKVLNHSAFLGLEAEHFKSDSRHLAGIF